MAIGKDDQEFPILQLPDRSLRRVFSYLQGRDARDAALSCKVFRLLAGEHENYCRPMRNVRFEPRALHVQCSKKMGQPSPQQVQYNNSIANMMHVGVAECHVNASEFSDLRRYATVVEHSRMNCRSIQFLLGDFRMTFQQDCVDWIKTFVRVADPRELHIFVKSSYYGLNQAQSMPADFFKMDVIRRLTKLTVRSEDAIFWPICRPDLNSLKALTHVVLDLEVDDAKRIVDFFKRFFLSPHVQKARLRVRMRETDLLEQLGAVAREIAGDIAVAKSDVGTWNFSCRPNILIQTNFSAPQSYYLLECTNNELTKENAENLEPPNRGALFQRANNFSLAGLL